MKRIYLALALVGGLSFGVKAQNVDLESQVVFRSENVCLSGLATDTIQPLDTTQNNYGVWGVVNNGPEDLLSGDKVMYIFPKSTISSQGIDVYFNTLTANAPANSLAFAGSYLSMGDINTLLDIDSFEAGATSFSSLLVPRAELVNNKIYGFYLYAVGIGDDPNNPQNTDGDQTNDFGYFPIKWNCSATSIAEMIEGAKKQSLNVYPNPANTEIKFTQNFDKKSNVTVIIRDAVGRALITKNYGKVSGSQDFKIDVTSLVTGLYTVEMQSDYTTGVSKFSKL